MDTEKAAPRGRLGRVIRLLPAAGGTPTRAAQVKMGAAWFFGLGLFLTVYRVLGVFGLYFKNRLVYVAIPLPLGNAQAVAGLVLTCLVIPALLAAVAALALGLFGGHDVELRGKRLPFARPFRVGLAAIPLILAAMTVLWFLSIRYGVTLLWDGEIGLFTARLPKGMAFPPFGATRRLIYAVLLCAACVLLDALLSLRLIAEKAGKRRGWRRVVRVVLAVLCTLFATLGVLFFTGVGWMADTFGQATAEEIIFQIRSPMQGVDKNLVGSFITSCLLPALAAGGLALLVFLLATRYSVSIKLLDGTTREKRLGGQKNLAVGVLALALAAAVLVGNFSHFAVSFGFDSYIADLTTKSRFIDDNYVDPATTALTFPEKKRNLIYIFLESMENTYMDRANGGVFAESPIPGLTALAEENVSFSSTDSFGGALQLPYTSWTIAGMVAQSAGVPLKIPIDNNAMNNRAAFMPGLTGLGDLLKDAGYNNALMFGSDAAFGGRLNYYAQHGDYEILDYDAAKRDGIIPEDYFVFWGFEDKNLYTYAKQELGRLAAQDEPFALTMLTVDTHFPQGYVCDLCPRIYDDQYWNVHACADRQITDFVAWLQAQDFYEDTTVVLAGDHLTMATSTADYAIAQNPDYVRTTYNAILNAAAQPENTKNRQFSTMDWFPTTLAAMGVQIEGERLALGTNLFSARPTLIEEFGLEEAESGLARASILYDSLF